jgi:hypothetical protein
MEQIRTSVIFMLCTHLLTKRPDARRVRPRTAPGNFSRSRDSLVPGRYVGHVATGITLSICTPSYNYAHYIDDALASVALQHQERAEHVVVDHGSDNTVDLLREADYPRLVWAQKSTVGISDTLNACLDMSSGEWIGLLNADDYYLPDAFTTVLRAIEQNPDVDFIFGETIEVDVHGRVRRLSTNHPLSKRVVRWGGRTGIAFAATFMRKSAMPRHMFDTELEKSQDWDITMGFLAKGSRFLYLPAPLVATRRHGDQSSIGGSRWSELLHIRERYGLARNPRVVAVTGAAALVEHRARKLLNGGYRRELRAKSTVGTDTRWFTSERAASTTRGLVDALSTSSR